MQIAEKNDLATAEREATEIPVLEPAVLEMISGGAGVVNTI